MRRRLVFLAALILWIVYAKDQLLPHVTAVVGESTLSYIATGLLTFAGSWILWRLVKG